MSAQEIKTKMIGLLDGGNGWCQGSNAIDSDGDPCAALSEDAVKWDLMGALMKANFDWNMENTAVGEPTLWSHYKETYEQIKEAIWPDFADEDVSIPPIMQWNFDFELWNDSATWGEVLAVLS